MLVSTGAGVTAAPAALADPLRLEIIGVLADSECCACDLLERVPVAGNLLSYHLRVLREAGLVQARRHGRWVNYRLHAQGFAAMWGELAVAGMPLPGQPEATRPASPSCRDSGGAR